MQIDEPIFRSVQQALHFSFLMETLPVSQKSQMQEIYRQGGKRVWEEENFEPSTINFGGLTPLEVRGQCALVLGAVNNKLPDPEACAVFARYAHQTKKAAGVRGVRDYARHLLSAQGDMDTLAIAWSIFCDAKQSESFSTRAIADEFGLSQSSVARDVKSIISISRALHNRAIDRLSEYFIASNLVSE